MRNSPYVGPNVMLYDSEACQQSMHSSSPERRISRLAKYLIHCSTPLTVPIRAGSGAHAIDFHISLPYVLTETAVVCISLQQNFCKVAIPRRGSDANGELFD
jgi:hypothetical protein